MLDQALEYFKLECERQGEEHLLLDSYIPADGTYLIVQRTESGFEQKEPLEIKLDKKTYELDRTSRFDDMKFICMADYYSCLVSIDKPVGQKQIHSNNYLSFFAKKAKILGKNPNVFGKPVDGQCIMNYYQALREPMAKAEKNPPPQKKKTNSRQKKPNYAEELYQSIETEIGIPDKRRIDEIESWITDNLPELKQSLLGGILDEDYLKIFFRYGNDPEEWKRDYQREGGHRYRCRSVFNDNKKDIEIDGELFGSPNNNISANSKKPYLPMKSRKHEVPYLVTLDQALFQQKFFIYLLNFASVGKINLYLNEDGITALKYNEMLCLKERETFTGLFLRIQKKKEVEIHDVDVISQYSPNQMRPFKVQEVLVAEFDKLPFPMKKAEHLRDMQDIVNQAYFGKALLSNYFTEAKHIAVKGEPALLRSLLLARTALFGWFWKGDETRVWPVLKRIALPLIQGSIDRGFYYRAVAQFDLAVSFQIYFEGGKGSMSDTIWERRERLKEKIEGNEAAFIQDDAEYFYGAGQVAGYLINKSKAGKIKLALGNPIIDAKQDQILKERLHKLYKKYGYDLEQGKDRRFANLYAMVLRYTPETAVDEMILTAGLLDWNLLYTKKGKLNGADEPEGQEE